MSERIRIRTPLAALLSVALWSGVSNSYCAAEKSASAALFRIGAPDGRAAEFGLTHEGYAAFKNRYNTPLVYTVGESKPRDLLDDVLTGPLSDAEDVIFAVRQPGKDGHWYANFGYYAESTSRTTYGSGGRLCRTNLRTGKVSVLLDDPRGGIRDPQVHYDGKKTLFSYRKGDSSNYHLYEINIDGSGLTQLTDGLYDDIEPTYLPDGSYVAPAEVNGGSTAGSPR